MTRDAVHKAARLAQDRYARVLIHHNRVFIRHSESMNATDTKGEMHAMLMLLPKVCARLCVHAGAGPGGRALPAPQHPPPPPPHTRRCCATMSFQTWSL